jgi:hypothetical protein
MAGITSKQNGALGGRPKNRKNNKTIEREAAREAHQQLVLENLRPLFQKQLLLAMGTTYVYRIDRHGKGSTLRIEHVLLENPREIADALDVLANHDPNGDEEGNGFVYISTKPPENRAIDSLLDRTLGKATQTIGGDKDNPLEVVNIIKYAKGGKPSA